MAHVSSGVRGGDQTVLVACMGDTKNGYNILFDQVKKTGN
jgi:hypothetical protein